MLPSTILSVILYSASIFLLVLLPFAALIWQVIIYVLLGQNELSDAIAGYGVMVFIIMGIVIAIAIGLSSGEYSIVIGNKFYFRISAFGWYLTIVKYSVLQYTRLKSRKNDAEYDTMAMQ